MLAPLVYVVKQVQRQSYCEECNTKTLNIYSTIKAKDIEAHEAKQAKSGTSKV